MKVALAVAALLAVGACKKSHEEAVAATRQACIHYISAAQSTQDCDVLADRAMDVAKPFQDVSNDRELAAADEELITGCIDRIALAYERCKTSAAFERAMDRLMFAVVQ